MVRKRGAGIGELDEKKIAKTTVNMMLLKVGEWRPPGIDGKVHRHDPRPAPRPLTTHLSPRPL